MRAGKRRYRRLARRGWGGVARRPPVIAAQTVAERASATYATHGQALPQGRVRVPGRGSETARRRIASAPKRRAEHTQKKRLPDTSANAGPHPVAQTAHKASGTTLIPHTPTSPPPRPTHSLP